MTFKYFLLTLIFLPLVGCTSFFYTPNSHNVPVFEKKGQLKLNAALDNQMDHIQYEAQGAYSFHRHWGIMVNSGLVKTRAQHTERFGKATFAEVGAGYFTKSKQAGVREFHFQAFAGYGRGKVLNIKGLGNYYEIGYSRYFLQPAWAYKWNYEYMSVTLISSLRLSTMDYRWSSHASIGQTHIEIREIRDIHPHPFLIEPAITLQAGWKRFQIQQQFIILMGHNPSGRSRESLSAATGIIFFLF